MIAYLKGEVIDVNEDTLVLEVNQVGYNIKISSQTAQFLVSMKDIIKIYTYTCVREDTFCLYGFMTKDDLKIFKKLITVNGIGPKGALAILSTMSADDLRYAIISGDAKAISKAPGIGAKTAARVILDLKDKVSIEDTFINQSMGMHSMDVSQENIAQKEAMEALVALGYSASDALRTMKQIELTENMEAEDILKAALKKISFL
ncbi:MAG TPA: Holliday junction branch migration protein RuvA [Lachnospiraceae bacterium]|nr:Holliday junction branch migration protein RuvA [Lachnospiraceae bacterium]